MSFNFKSKKSIRVAKWFFLSLIFAVIALCIAVIMWNYIGNRNFKETFYSVSCLKADNRIRVIQISDLHKSVYGKDNQKLISRVEKLNPDIILFTGDCMESNDESVDNILNLCTEAAKIAPSYYIYGNNEVERFYDIPLNCETIDKKYGFDDENRDPDKLLSEKDSFEAELEETGVKVLKNEYDSIVVGSTEVDIYGVLTSNPSSFWAYAGKSFDDYIYWNENHLKITAIHEPFVFKEFEPESWGDVIFAGHTHGGLAKIPVIGPLYTHEGGLLPEREGGYVYGRYDVVGRPLIISSGLTNSNLLRINNQPELVIVDINKF